MDTVIRGIVVYLALLLVFRLSGSRTLAQTTPFDFVLLLIISETIQQALVDDDNSMTNGFLLVLTLVSVSVALSVMKQHIPFVERLVDGAPLIILENGNMHQERMDKERVDEEDILEAARKLQGLERLEQIKYAVLERNGEITIVPKPSEK
jgi:uncharacterized membrane protein YcaP (DUF421 family)